MRLQANGSKAARILCVVSAALGLGTPAAAQLVNIDLQGDPPTDLLHAGDDGILSAAGGTVWNGVESGVDAAGLLDEDGFGSGVDVMFASSGGGTIDLSATNDLQDSGSLRTFDILGLDSASSYDVAIYAMPSSFVGFTDSSGFTGGVCTASPTYSLPGTLDDDYCIYEDRLPADLGGGEFGFTLSPLDGVITGVQVLHEAGAVPGLLFGTATLGILGRQRRRRVRARSRVASVLSASAPTLAARATTASDSTREEHPVNRRITVIAASLLLSLLSAVSEAITFPRHAELGVEITSMPILGLGGPSPNLHIVAYEVRNAGDAGSPESAVALSRDGVELCRQTIPALAPGAVHVGILVVGEPLGGARSSWTLEVDPERRIEEYEGKWNNVESFETDFRDPRRRAPVGG